MELATFGAVLGFAMDLERQLVTLYRELQNNASGELSTKLAQAVEAAQRRVKLLEQVRRENVAEMILEPIAGFKSEDYILEGVPASGVGLEASMEVWREAERMAVRFYTLGAQKLPIPEVKRVFERLAKEHERLTG